MKFQAPGLLLMLNRKTNILLRNYEECMKRCSTLIG